MADPDGSPPTPPGPPPARVTPPGSAGSGRSARSYLAPAAGIIRSSSQGSIVQEGAEPIPRAASTGALRRPSSAQRSATGTLPSITDPPPAPHPLTEKLDRSKVKVPPAPPTAGSTVKWVPHTHANPKHARFCFICLHGKLEGERDGIDEEVKRQKAEDGDLPNQVDMKELGYLLPTPPGASSEGGFRRAGADYERNNLTAVWLREVTGKVYDDSIKPMIIEQNTALSLSVDVKLVNHAEDEQDRKALARLFTLSEEQQVKVDEDIELLGEWCTKHEPKLLDVMPPPKEIGALPEVEGPSDRQKQLLEYLPLLDLSQLKGPSAQSLGATLSAMQQTKTDAHLLFKAEDLPRPLTQPDMAEVDIVPYPLTEQDIPGYQEMQAAIPTRQPVSALRDPFQRPFLYMPEFHETLMPVFESSSNYGQCRIADAVPAEEMWLSTTMSIFQDNNDPEKVRGWGYVPPRKRVMPVLIDEPYLPPYDMVGCAEGVGKKIMLRGIWDAELFNREGKMVPPLKERGRGLYIPIPVEHPDLPVWSPTLSPQKSREEKVTSLIPTIPVRSYTRFRPKKVLADMPGFLWDLVREDAAGQGLWDVIRQRHDIPREEAEMRQAELARLQEEIDEEESQITATEEAEKAQIRAFEGSKDLPAGSPSASRPGTQQSRSRSRPGTRQEASRPGTTQSGVRQEGSRPGTGQATLQPPGTGTAPSSPSNAGPTRPPLAEPSAHLPRMEIPAPSTPLPSNALPGATMAPAAGGISARSGVSGSPVHLEERSTQLVSLGETRKVEELLADDRFLDSLAGKLANRLGGMGLQAPGGTAGAHGASGTLGGTFLGHTKRPEPPSFQEGAIGPDGNKATLPRALQVGGGQPVDKTSKGVQRGDNNEVHMTNMDVNAFTQEKMRGECYVRLLVHPDAASAKKAIVPYQGDMMNPDISLVMGSNRPNLVVPPKGAVPNEEGEMIEDDEFADFEKHDNVAFSFVRHNRYEAIEAIIQQESGILEAKDEFGNNMLHIACQNDHRRIAKLLLKNGINVNDQNKAGNTPLHYCFQYNFLHLSDYLIAHGADETIANKKGLLPSEGTGLKGGMGV